MCVFDDVNVCCDRFNIVWYLACVSGVAGNFRGRLSKTDNALHFAYFMTRGKKESQMFYMGRDCVQHVWKRVARMDRGGGVDSSGMSVSE